jgi:hypothetical protein
LTAISVVVVLSQQIFSEAVDCGYFGTAANSLNIGHFLGAEFANKQLELMHRFMGELGLSPASRSRVAAFPSLTPKPWDLDDDFACDPAPASPAASPASRPSRSLLS